jgi:hypothetical protein
MADVELQIFGCLCATEKFVVNGVKADSDDFGSQGDASPETAEDYGCGDMRFTPAPASQDILDKYRITVDEYNEIAEMLREGLSFGGCGWCS